MVLDHLYIVYSGSVCCSCIVLAMIRFILYMFGLQMVMICMVQEGVETCVHTGCTV